MRSLALLLLVAACGGSEATAPTTNDPNTIVAGLYAMTEVSEATTSQSFDMNMQVMTAPDTTTACARATAAAGSCCYLPFLPVATQPPGAGGGTPAPSQSSAGPMTFTNATSNVNLRTFAFESGEYANAPASYTATVWQPGDALRVTATGSDQIGAFTVSAPALIPPVVQSPGAIARSQSATITWQPDPNADVFWLTLLDGDGAQVVCTASDAAGTVTIDATLLAQLSVGPRAQAVGQRLATHYAQTSTGRIAFTTIGWKSFDMSLE